MDVTTGLSALVIAAPVYLGLSWWMRKSFANGNMEPKSTLRKWLVYFTVFITAIIGIVDLIATLNTYLNGDFTVRFFFKALTILIIAGSIFAFYLWDIRRENPKPSRITHSALWATIVIVILTVVTGFVLVGSPKTRRLLQWDQQRVSSLQNIVQEMYYPQTNNTPNKPLPENSEAFAHRFRDPETDKPLEYRKINADKFEVCATFTFPAENIDQLNAPYPTKPVDPYYIQPDFTALENHAAGHQCFSYTIVRPVAPVKE